MCSKVCVCVYTFRYLCKHASRANKSDSMFLLYDCRHLHVCCTYHSALLNGTGGVSFSFLSPLIPLFVLSHCVCVWKCSQFGVCKCKSCSRSRSLAMVHCSVMAQYSRRNKNEISTAFISINITACEISTISTNSRSHTQYNPQSTCMYVCVFRCCFIYFLCAWMLVVFFAPSSFVLGRSFIPFAMFTFGSDVRSLCVVDFFRFFFLVVFLFLVDFPNARWNVCETTTPTTIPAKAHTYAKKQQRKKTEKRRKMFTFLTLFTGRSVEQGTYSMLNLQHTEPRTNMCTRYFIRWFHLHLCL